MLLRKLNILKNIKTIIIKIVNVNKRVTIKVLLRRISVRCSKYTSLNNSKMSTKDANQGTGYGKVN